MDPTILISYRKTATTTTSSAAAANTENTLFHKLKSDPAAEQRFHTSKLGSDKVHVRSSKDVFDVEHSRTILSSSLSTTYASSSSSSAASTTSEEELATARRYSDSNRSSTSSTSSSTSSSLGTSSSMAVDSLSNSSHSAQECANSNAAFVVDEDDLCNNNALVQEAAVAAAATAKFDKVNLNAESEPSSIIELKPVTEIGTKKLPGLGSALPKNCFVSLYVNGKRCLLTMDAQCLVYEPELSSSCSNERVTIRIDHILSVWACHCEHRRSGFRGHMKPALCPCLVLDPDRRTLNVPAVDPASGVPFSIKVFYAAQSASEGLKLEMLLLGANDANNNNHNKAGVDAKAASEHLLIDMAYKIKDTIETFDRPKRLLLFVNPYGGSQKATAILEDEIKPILALGRIDYSIVITDRANHARDILLDASIDLRQYDGIVCVGGDGMFGEILNGVLIRTQREHGVAFGNIESVPVKPPLKLGVIAAGSTDAIVYATSGHKAPVNSTLAIALGRQVNIDVTAVHQRDEDRLIQYTASFLGYGFFGDTLADSERNRWLGPRRYDWAGIKKFFKHRLYSGEIKLSIEPSDGSPKEYNPCGVNCNTCQKAGKKSRQTLEADDSPACISIRGRFLAINAATVSCRCAKSKYGMSPMAHVGNGCTDLILISKCSRWKYLKYLYRLAMSNKSPFDFNFVDVYRVREFEFNPIIEPHKRKSYYTEKKADCDFFDAFAEAEGIEGSGDQTGPSSLSVAVGASSSSSSTNAAFSSKKRRPGGYSLSSSVWNCDGEVINEAAIHVKVHCQLVTVFGAGCEVHELLADRPTTVRFQ